jgi:hypothetical protein
MLCPPYKIDKLFLSCRICQLQGWDIQVINNLHHQAAGIVAGIAPE